MKISKIQKIVKSEKSLVSAIDTEGKQWIGTGSALYCVEGMPQMNTAQIFTFLDIPADQAADFYIKTIEDGFIMPEELAGAPSDAVIDDEDSMSVKGEELRVLTSENGTTVFVKPRYLAPVENGDAGRCFITKDENYVLVYDGIFLQAIIGRMKVSDYAKTRISEIYSAIRSERK